MPILIFWTISSRFAGEILTKTDRCLAENGTYSFANLTCRPPMKFAANRIHAIAVAQIGMMERRNARPQSYPNDASRSSNDTIRTEK